MAIKRLVSGIVVLLAAGHCFAVGESRLYWTTFTSGELSKVQRASLDGEGIVDVVTGLDAPWPIEIDPLRLKLYYGDVNREVIQRANLDGTDVEAIDVGVPIDNPSGLAIDPVNNELYWSDHVYDRIHKTDLDTNMTTVLVSAQLTNPFGLALDLEAGKLYWADTGIGRPGKIQRSNLDGTDVEDLVTGLSNPRDVAIDFVAGHIFWPDLSVGAIYRAELDGSDAGIWLTDTGGSDAVAIDPISRRLYWTSNRDGISSIRLDGSDLRVGVVPSLNQFGIAILVPEPFGQVQCFLAFTFGGMWCRTRCSRWPRNNPVANENAPACSPGRFLVLAGLQAGARSRWQF
jgi:low density lipoprotein receptor-related protein 5/6